MPRAGSTLNYPDPVIVVLKNDLYRARQTIVRLMPEAVQAILESYRNCSTREESRGWHNSVVEQIIPLAKVTPPPPGWPGSGHGYCPLCGDGPDSWGYQEGYAIPEGLRRHLVGWGNSRQCDVMDAANSLAHDYFDRSFKEAELAVAAEAQRVKATRLRTETLYQATPFGIPELIDKGSIYQLRQTRREDQMVWAEQRLASLGFVIHLDGMVKSYQAEGEDAIVYADPRENGRISFRAYRKPLPKAKRKVDWNVNSGQYFYLLDSWKNDIVGKYQSRLAEAMTRLK